MMKGNREFLLKVGAACAVALFVLDQVVIEPGFRRWKEQGERITKLSTDVKNGDKLLSREQALRDHWTMMQHENLPEDNSAAESQIIKAISRWEASSRVIFTNLNKGKQWKLNDDGSETLDFVISINGDQSSIGRFIYEAQTDTIPVYLKQYNLSSHDTRGTQLTLAATFSFLRLPKTK
jgi:hypothetical protein